MRLEERFTFKSRHTEGRTGELDVQARQQGIVGRGQPRSAADPFFILKHIISPPARPSAIPTLRSFLDQFRLYPRIISQAWHSLRP